MNVSWKQSLGVWWSFIWRASIYGLIGGGILGGIAGVLAVVITQSSAHSAQWGQIAGYLASIPASMLAIKQALAKHLLALTELTSQSNPASVESLNAM